MASKTSRKHCSKSVREYLGIIHGIWNNHVVRGFEMFKHSGLYADKNLVFEYQKEINRRMLLPLQRIDDLSQPIEDKWFANNTIDSQEALFYGAMQTLLDYCGLTCFTMPPLNLGVQHGYVFEICNWEKSKLEKRNLVWSKKLVDMYHEHTSNQDIYAIGAPFFYAKSLLDESQLELEKKRLGRNLLAFPMHSQSHVDTNFDPNKFLNILKEERKRFETVRVCMYWKDILRGSHKLYLDAGFECVCNGHLYDPNFLRRQKTLFELADATISNGVGSHIGYSLYMGKPHWLIDDEYEYVNSKKGGDADDLTSVVHSDNFLSVKRAFLNNDDYKITTVQKKVIDSFWGISDILTKKQLRSLLIELYGITTNG